MDELTGIIEASHLLKKLTGSHTPIISITLSDKDYDYVGWQVSLKLSNYLVYDSNLQKEFIYKGIRIVRENPRA